MNIWNHLELWLANTLLFTSLCMLQNSCKISSPLSISVHLILGSTNSRRTGFSSVLSPLEIGRSHLSIQIIQCSLKTNHQIQQAPLLRRPCVHWGRGAKVPRTHPQPAWNSSQRATSTSVSWHHGECSSCPQRYRQQSLRDICRKSYEVAPPKDKSSAQWEMPTYLSSAKDTKASAQTKWQDRIRPQIDLPSVAVTVLLLAPGFRSLWAAQRRSGCQRFSLLGSQHHQHLLSYYWFLKRFQLRHVSSCLLCLQREGSSSSSSPHQAIGEFHGKHGFNESRAVFANSESTCLANTTSGQTAMPIRIHQYT